MLEKLSLHVLFFMPNTFWYGIEANDLESACLVFHAECILGGIEANDLESACLVLHA